MQRCSSSECVEKRKLWWQVNISICPEILWTTLFLPFFVQRERLKLHCVTTFYFPVFVTLVSKYYFLSRNQKEEWQFPPSNFAFVIWTSMVWNLPILSLHFTQFQCWVIGAENIFVVDIQFSCLTLATRAWCPLVADNVYLTDDELE